MVDLAKFDAKGVLYYGGHKAADLLQQFGKLRGERAYRAILVLTDDGSLDLADDTDPVRDFGAPVFLVHLGGALPPGYDDATLATMQKRGGAALTSVPRVFEQLAAADRAGEKFAGLDAGYLFTVERDEGAGQESEAAKADAFSAIAARQLIKFAMRTMDVSQAAELDRLHEVAGRYQVVTPYSSMIVLVDEAQREALRKAEAEADRFKRESGSGSEAPPAPSDVLVTATPEPGEGALLGLCAAGMVLLYLRQRRLAPQGRALF